MILVISDLDKNIIDNLKKDHYNLQVTQAQVIIRSTSYDWKGM